MKSGRDVKIGPSSARRPLVTRNATKKATGVDKALMMAVGFSQSMIQVPVRAIRRMIGKSIMHKMIQPNAITASWLIDPSSKLSGRRSVFLAWLSKKTLFTMFQLSTPTTKISTARLTWSRQAAIANSNRASIEKVSQMLSGASIAAAC
jgi:hypothetical protein